MTRKYDPLGDGGPLGGIAAIGTDAITMTFAAVEAVVGPLPQVAYVSGQWWGATASGRFDGYPSHWRRMGYVADRPDFAVQTVTFRRIDRRSSSAAISSAEAASPLVRIGSTPD